jgi:hypothetical protein
MESFFHTLKTGLVHHWHYATRQEATRDIFAYVEGFYNRTRLWLASFAYVLLCAVRRIGLHHTPFANASCGTIRLKLLKIGALVRVSVRRIKIAMASSCPAAEVWGRAAVRLVAAGARGSPA